MTDTQWQTLLKVVRWEPVGATPPIGFIIDSPWLPKWHGIRILDYFTNEERWFQANAQAIQRFPEVTFLPGFWSEFGMCTEPSVFGCKCVFYRDEFPFADKVIKDPAQVDDLVEPNPATDGLLPFMLNRLRSVEPRLRDLGHAIRFSVSRGPLNVATFLMGTTEFLMAIKTEPEQMHKLLRLITRYLKNWHELQRETFPSIDGTFMLDDIVGFLGEKDFLEFGLPYLKEVFANDTAVKFFHNDAQCAKSLPYYREAGINLYNPGIFNNLAELRQLAGGPLAILGNIPPRDVLANGAPADVARAVKWLLDATPDRRGLMLSCAGGMPPSVSTENLRAFVEAARG